VAPSAGAGWAGRRATAPHPPVRVGGRLRHRLPASTVAATKGSGWQEMGGSPHLRWVPIVATMWLAAAAPAFAQSPAGPDAAPSGSKSGPKPDPAPIKAKPIVRPAAKQVVRPVATVRAPVQTTAPAAPAPARVTKATTKPDRKKPATRKHHAPAAAKHRTIAHAPSLPTLTPARLIAPQATADASRARKLAAGALSLLLLTLASATLLAFAVRVERGRVVR